MRTSTRSTTATGAVRGGVPTEQEISTWSKKQLKACIAKERRIEASHKRISHVKPGWTNEVVMLCCQVLEEIEKPVLEEMDEEEAPEQHRLRKTRAQNIADPTNDNNRDDDDYIAHPLVDEDIPISDFPDTEEDVTLRPGPLLKAQVRECGDFAETSHLWVQEKAKQWRVSKSTVAHALGLHNTEVHADNTWNMHQTQFFETLRLPGEAFSETRRHCQEDYAVNMREGQENLTEEEKEAVNTWIRELEEWTEDCNRKRTQEHICAGQRYKVMVDLWKELSERAQWMADRWQIHIIGMVVTGAPDDPIAQAASFAFAGSMETQSWWNIKNVPTALLLGDMETLCCGKELKSREKGMPLSLRSFPQEEDRDLVSKAVKDRLQLLFNSATEAAHKRFRWKDFARFAIDGQVTLCNWPAQMIYPGGSKEMKALNSELYRHLFLRFQKDTLDDVPVQDTIYFAPWTENEKNMDDDDDAYGQIPLVVCENKKVLLSVAQAEKIKAGHQPAKRSWEESNHASGAEHDNEEANSSKPVTTL